MNYSFLYYLIEIFSDYYYYNFTSSNLILSHYHIVIFSISIITTKYLMIYSLLNYFCKLHYKYDCDLQEVIKFASNHPSYKLN